MNCEDCYYYKEKTNTEGECTQGSSYEDVQWNGGCPAWKPKDE